MAERKQLSKKMRFEVFKRDSFTCQYCGASAPEAILEVDHIVPVAKGGTNDILNLVTSCRDCNRGKSARELSDDSVVKKQKAQLDELNEKREQTEMLVEWKKELQSLTDEQADAINDCITSISGIPANDYGKSRIKKWIRDFGFSEVYTSTEISFYKYYVDGDTDTWELAFDKIGGVCYNRRKQRQEDGH